MIKIKSLLPVDRQSWLLVAGVAGVALMGALLALGPVRREFKLLRVDVVEQERLLAHQLGVLAPKPYSVVTNEYARYGALIKMRGSSDEENSKMLSEVDRLAGESKIALLATKPRDTKKERDTESYTVEIEVETSLSQLMGFLYALETSSQLLRVDKLILDAKGAKSADSIHGTMLISKVVTL